jgi:hypothetical protein
MATTDARPGFRLPWSSDQRSQPEDAGDTPAADATAQESTDEPMSQPATEAAATEGNETMAESTAATETPVPAPTKRPNKFLADLTKAMQAAAESARDEAMARIQADAKSHIEAIHERSATDAADLRRKADDDVAAVREWSKAEIARIREETDEKISARKGNLEFEIEEHAARIERQIEHVQGRVGGFEADMAQFFEKLLAEDDPTRFASLAENLPEPPPFDLDELAASAWLDSQSSAPAAEAATIAAAAEAGATTESHTTDAGWRAAETAAEAPAEPVADAPAEDVDPRLAAFGMSADFAAAEAEAFEAAGSADESEDIPVIADDALAARLAGLVGADDAAVDGATPATQVIVTGLVSVASIASFKRHLGRLAGVQSVGVSSGPDGEFVFAVSHGADIDLRESIPTLQGFQARVTGGSDGSIQVTARDPESEG